MKFYTMFLFSFLMISCSWKNNELKDILHWNGKEMDFDVSMKLNVLGKDTLCPDLLKKKYKMLVYVGPKGCSSCQIPLYSWKKMIDSLQHKCTNLSIVFVICVDNYQEFEYLERINKFYYPVFYDRDGTFAKKNKISQEKTVQVFLLNEENKVLAIGDPVKKATIYNLYLKIIHCSTG